MLLPLPGQDFFDLILAWACRHGIDLSSFEDNFWRLALEGVGIETPTRQSLQQRLEKQCGFLQEKVC